jgi:hypothetical protein
MNKPIVALNTRKIVLPISIVIVRAEDGDWRKLESQRPSLKPPAANNPPNKA